MSVLKGDRQFLTEITAVNREQLDGLLAREQTTLNQLADRLLVG